MDLQKRQYPRASLLGLPQELRDQIYDLAIPWGTYHIEHDVERYEDAGRIRTRRIEGKGLIRKLCYHDDYERAQIEPNPHIETWYDDEEDNVHQECLNGTYCAPENHDQPDAQRRPENSWAFALLFVNHQTHDELRSEIYKRCAFSFLEPDAFEVFVDHASPKDLFMIRDLRLRLLVAGPSHNSLSCEPDLGHLGCAFTGLRSLQALLCFQNEDVYEILDTIKPPQKLSAFVSQHLSFGRLPLERASIIMQCEQEDPDSFVHNLYRYGQEFCDIVVEDEDLMACAQFVQEQLLTPCDEQMDFGRSSAETSRA